MLVLQTYNPKNARNYELIELAKKTPAERTTQQPQSISALRAVESCPLSKPLPHKRAIKGGQWHSSSSVYGKKLSTHWEIVFRVPCPCACVTCRACEAVGAKFASGEGVSLRSVSHCCSCCCSCAMFLYVSPLLFIFDFVFRIGSLFFSCSIVGFVRVFPLFPTAMRCRANLLVSHLVVLISTDAHGAHTRGPWLRMKLANVTSA